MFDSRRFKYSNWYFMEKFILIEGLVKFYFERIIRKYLNF